MNKDNLAQRLQWLLEQARNKLPKLNQTQFAAAAGLSKSYISLMLSGDKQNPTDEAIASIARAYGANVRWLKDGEGEVWVDQKTGVNFGKLSYPALGLLESGLRTKDVGRHDMSEQEFRDAADRFGVECHIRGHREAARALMDLVDELDHRLPHSPGADAKGNGNSDSDPSFGKRESA